MSAPSHIVRNTVGAVVAFVLVLSAIAIFAGAGIAVVAVILVAGLALPLVAFGAIHRDEGAVEKLAKRTHR